jgi:LmbE family N-acetylglucosaminyl deacetylase
VDGVERQSFGGGAGLTALQFTGVKKVLCLGAHSDDIEIGCGGTLLKLIQQLPELEFYWFVFSAKGLRSTEARRSAREFLRGAKQSRIQLRDFRESYFPSQWAAIKEAFEELKVRFEPDLIFTHHRDDRHQDHSILSDLTWNSFRHHLILEYEIPKYDGDLGQPNLFVPLDEKICQAKISALLRNFKSQTSKHWFTTDTLSGMLRIRGVECAAGNAEAFYCRKLIL